MSFEGIRLVVATDNIRAGLRFALGVSLAEKPSWCMVTDDPKVIAVIPDGFACVSHWTERNQTAAQLAWRDRQASGKSSGVDLAMLKRIEEWQARRAEEERRLAFAHLEAEQTIATESANDDGGAQAVTESPSQAQKTGGSKWR